MMAQQVSKIPLSRTNASILVSIIFLIHTKSVLISVCYPFQDVSQQAGMLRPYGGRKKYGGPSIADLDGDGWPDLLFGHHGGRACIQVYFNNQNGTFTQSDFTFYRDLHGINAMRVHPSEQTMHFLLYRGKKRTESSSIAHLPCAT